MKRLILVTLLVLTALMTYAQKSAKTNSNAKPAKVEQVADTSKAMAAPGLIKLTVTKEQHDVILALVRKKEAGIVEDFLPKLKAFGANVQANAPVHYELTNGEVEFVLLQCVGQLPWVQVDQFMKELFAQIQPQLQPAKGPRKPAEKE